MHSSDKIKAKFRLSCRMSEHTLRTTSIQQSLVVHTITEITGRQGGWGGEGSRNLVLGGGGGGGGFGNIKKKGFFL